MNIIYINIYNISYFISVFMLFCVFRKKFKNLLFIWNFYVILRCFKNY